MYYVDRPVTARFTRYMVGINPEASSRWAPGENVNVLRSFVKVIFLCKYAAAMEGPHMVRFVPPASFLSVHPCRGPCAKQDRCECLHADCACMGDLRGRCSSRTMQDGAVPTRLLLPLAHSTQPILDACSDCISLG